MTKKQTKQQTKTDSVKDIVDTTKVHVDNMLSSMRKASKDISTRIADNKKQHEDNKLAESNVRRNKHAYKTKDSFKVSEVATMSRRKAIILLLHEAKYTKLDINNILIKTHDIADKSNNMKAISGTMYDLQSNTTCNFKTDNETDVISCISENCKYKHAK